MRRSWMLCCHCVAGEDGDCVVDFDEEDDGEGDDDEGNDDDDKVILLHLQLITLTFLRRQ